MQRRGVFLMIAAGAAALVIWFLSIQRGSPGSDVTPAPDSAEELVSTVETPQVDVPRFPPFVVVTLGPPALSIEGTVVDDDDRPVPRARVWIAESTPLFRATTEEATAHFFENLCADSNWSVKMTPVSWMPVDADAEGRTRGAHGRVLREPYRDRPPVDRVRSVRRGHDRERVSWKSSPRAVVPVNGIQSIANTNAIGRFELRTAARSGSSLHLPAGTLVLYRDDEIVDRLPIQIAEEGITIVRG